MVRMTVGGEVNWDGGVLEVNGDPRLRDYAVVTFLKQYVQERLRPVDAESENANANTNANACDRDRDRDRLEKALS